MRQLLPERPARKAFCSSSSVSLASLRLCHFAQQREEEEEEEEVEAFSTSSAVSLAAAAAAKRRIPPSSLLLVPFVVTSDAVERRIRSSCRLSVASHLLPGTQPRPRRTRPWRPRRPTTTPTSSSTSSSATWASESPRCSTSSRRRSVSSTSYDDRKRISVASRRFPSSHGRLPPHHRGRVRHADHRGVWPEDKAADLGHGGSGAVPRGHPVLLSRRRGRSHGLRRYQVRSLKDGRRLQDIDDGSSFDDRRSTYNHLSSWLTDARNLTNPNTVREQLFSRNRADMIRRLDCR